MSNKGVAMKKKDTLKVRRSTREETIEANCSYFRLEAVSNGEATIVRDHISHVSENVYTDLIHRLNYRGFDAKWKDKTHTEIKVNNYRGFGLII
jgi:hypothetical protein